MPMGELHAFSCILGQTIFFYLHAFFCVSSFALHVSFSFVSFSLVNKKKREDLDGLDALLKYLNFHLSFVDWFTHLVMICSVLLGN